MPFHPTIGANELQAVSAGPISDDRPATHVRAEQSSDVRFSQPGLRCQFVVVPDQLASGGNQCVVGRQ